METIVFNEGHDKLDPDLEYQLSFSVFFIIASVLSSLLNQYYRYKKPNHTIVFSINFRTEQNEIHCKNSVKYEDN